MTKRICKNQTASIIYINDLGAKQIPSYGETDFAESFTLIMMSESTNLAAALMTDIDANGYSQYLILNDGDKDLKAVDGLDLIRNIQQKTNQTVDGDSQFVLKAPSTISGNRVIDKHILKYILPHASYSKKFIIPSGKQWIIQSFGGSSTDTIGRLCLTYKNDNDITENIFVDPQYDFDLILSQQAGSSDTVLYVNNFNDELSIIEPNKYYKFAKYNDPTTTVLKKIVNINSTNNTITINQSLGSIFPIGSFIAHVEKPIRRLVVRDMTMIVGFNSPLKFIGTGSNSLTITLRNLDGMQSNICAFVNGYEEPV
jgi:hypothetical protein